MIFKNDLKILKPFSTKSNWIHISKTWNYHNCYTSQRASFTLGKYQLTTNSYFSVRPSRYEARGKFGERQGCVRVSRSTLASWVLSKVPKCFISRWSHSWRMNQLFSKSPLSTWYFNADVISVRYGNMKHARANELITGYSLSYNKRDIIMSVTWRTAGDILLIT